MTRRRSLLAALAAAAAPTSAHATTGFDASIDYGQIIVHREHLPRPGLLWTDQHVAQGFAWSDGIVAFGVPDCDGMCRIEVDVAPQHAFHSSDATLWAIAVPFDATEPGLQIGPVVRTRPFTIAPGRYQLTFEALPRGDGFTLNLFFYRDDRPVFAILKQGSLAAGHVLTRTAQGA